MAGESLCSYLFVIDSSTMSRDDAIEIIDKLDDVVNWQKILPDAAVLITKLNLNDLNNLILSNMNKQRFVIIKLESGKKNGWLAKASWDFMNHPKSVFDEDRS